MQQLIQLIQQNILSPSLNNGPTQNFFSRRHKKQELNIDILLGKHFISVVKLNDVADLISNGQHPEEKYIWQNMTLAIILIKLA